MAEIIPLYLDQLPAYIPFTVQCSSTGSAAMDPSVDSLIIYEDDGASSTFASTTITGSPFDPAKVNSQTGLWGVKVPKSAFTAGKYYIVYWEMSIDSVAAAKVEVYLACNAANFKADVSGVSTFDPSTDQVDVGSINGTVISGPDDLKAKVPRNHRLFGMPG